MLDAIAPDPQTLCCGSESEEWYDPSEQWLGSCLQVLDVSNVAKLSAGSKQPEAAAEITAALCAAVSAAGRNMIELNLDAATVSDELLAAVGRCCERLESLSIIGCRHFTDAGLEAVAQGCPLLKSLSVGGPSFGWRECTGLAAFKGLRQLTISRRSSLCTDSSLIKVLPGVKNILTLPQTCFSSILNSGSALCTSWH